MENKELNELCQKILGKSLDEVFDEFEKRPRKVMSFTLEATPSGFIVSTDVSKAALDNPVYGTRVQEAFDKINACFREESVSIANVGNKVSGFKLFTNIKEAMNGELHIGPLAAINIHKTGLEYDMSIVSENGTLHLCTMRDLPYYLIKALGNITEFPPIYHDNDIHLGSIREEIENGR